WTLTPPAIAARFEPGAPPVAERIDAMQRCSQRGYPVQANLTPVIPEGGWEDAYVELAREVVARVPLRKLTVGGIRLDARSLGLLEKGLGRDNAISEHLIRQPYVDDCRSFYKPGLLGKFY